MSCVPFYAFRYGRTLAFIEADGVNVSEEMLRVGLAWWYMKYSDSVDLAILQDEAKRGLWSGTEAPVASWDWRKQK